MRLHMKFAKSLMFILLGVLAFSGGVFAQKETEKNPPKNEFNAELAQKLGADDYGMKQYIFVVLKTDKTKIEDKQKISELQNGHLKNIMRLANEGKLVLAGPFIEGGEMRGLYIFDVKTIEEAKELVKTDPAINAGIFAVEFTKWYGSAALLEVNKLHSKNKKKGIVE